MNLSAILPRPTVVTLGGRPFRASELRVGDLRDLQAYVEDHLPDPYSVAEPFLIGGSGKTWKRLLADVCEEQQEWPPDLSSPEADRILGNDAGWGYFGWIVLRRCHPDLTPEAVGLLLRSATLIEIRRLSRIAWAIDPMTVLAQIVYGPDELTGQSRDWAKTWYHYLTESKHGPEFEELTLTQLACFMGKGEIPDGSQSSADVSEIDPDRQKRKAEFWAEIDGEESDDAAGGSDRETG